MNSKTPSPRRSADEQQKLETALRETFERLICFHEILGLKVTSFDPAAPQISFPMQNHLVGNYLHGRLHGGVISTVLDGVGGLAVSLAIAEKFPAEAADEVTHRFARLGTIDLRTDFLQQGLGKHFVATGRVIRLGGRIASVQMTLENDGGLLIATGAASYVVS